MPGPKACTDSLGIEAGLPSSHFSSLELEALELEALELEALKQLKSFGYFGGAASTRPCPSELADLAARESIERMVYFTPLDLGVLPDTRHPFGVGHLWEPIGS